MKVLELFSGIGGMHFALKCKYVGLPVSYYGILSGLAYLIRSYCIISN